MDWNTALDWAKVGITGIAATAGSFLWWKHRHEGEKTRMDQIEQRLTKHERECLEANLRTAEALNRLRDVIRDLKRTIRKFEGALLVLLKRDLTP